MEFLKALFLVAAGIFFGVLGLMHVFSRERTWMGAGAMVMIVTLAFFGARYHFRRGMGQESQISTTQAKGCVCAAIGLVVVICAVFFLVESFLWTSGADKRFNIAASRASNQDYGEALACINEEIQEAPESARAYAFRAVIQSQMGAHDEALADSKKALELDTESPGIHGARGYCLYRAGEYTEAIAECTEAMDTTEHRAVEAKLWRAAANRQSGNLSIALQQAKELAAELKPISGYRNSLDPAGYLRVTTNAEAMLMAHQIAGECLFDRKDYDAAMAAYENAVDTKGKGDVLFVKGQYEEAAKSYHTKYRGETRHQERAYREAACKMCLGNYREAHPAFYKIAVQGEPPDVRARAALLTWVAAQHFPSERSRGRYINDATELLKKQNELQAWPAPIVDLVLGKIQHPDCLQAAAATDIAEESARRECEASYFIGEAALASNKPEEARRAFTKCTESGLTCEHTYHFAVAALQRMP